MNKLLICLLCVSPGGYLFFCRTTNTGIEFKNHRPGYKPVSGAAAENRSRIVASVIKVEPAQEGHFQIHIEEFDTVQEFSCFAKDGERIMARPNFICGEGGKIDF